MKTVKRVIAIVVLVISLFFLGYISHACKEVKENIETANSYELAVSDDQFSSDIIFKNSDGV